MATTSWSYPAATTYRELVPELIDKKLQEYIGEEMILAPLIGKEGERLPIIRKIQLNKEAGDMIKIGMQGRLTNVPVLGDTTLEQTSEERLLFYDQMVYVNQVRNAVLDAGAMTRQRDAYNLHSRAQKALGTWMAQYIEKSLFYTMYYNYAPHVIAPVTTYGGLDINSNSSKPARYWYTADEVGNPITYSATDATYIANIKAAEAALVDDSTDRFGPAIIEGAVAKLKMMHAPKVRYKGLECYLGIIHPYQTYQLRLHEKFFTAMTQAMPRDAKSNPLFTGGIFNGALGYWNNCLLLESEYVHSGDETTFNTAWGISTVEIDSNVPNARRAIFLGSDAVAYATAVDPKIITKTDIDYNNLHGEAIAGIFGSSGCHYTSDDGNSTVVDQSRVIVSTYSPSTVIQGN